MRIFFFMALSVGVALAGFLAGCQKQKPPPSIDGLSDALERSAEKTLPAPSLADEQIIIPAKLGQTGAQTAEIDHAFTAAGGVAVSSVDEQGRVAIMADIPAVNVAAFKALLRHESAAMQTGSSPTRLIEVLIETPSPTPTP